MTAGVALTNASMIGCLKPFGVVAGAKAMNRLTFLFKSGLIDKLAKA
jgi:hypothetical protein